MKIIINTKSGHFLVKYKDCEETDFIREITSSKWLVIEQNKENIYLRTSEIESVVFDKKEGGKDCGMI